MVPFPCLVRRVVGVGAVQLGPCIPQRKELRLGGDRADGDRIARAHCGTWIDTMSISRLREVHCSVQLPGGNFAMTPGIRLPSRTIHTRRRVAALASSVS